MYKVGNIEFKTFKEVNQWAWDTHKICEFETPETEEEKQESCRQLEAMLLEATQDDECCGGCHHEDKTDV